MPPVIYSDESASNIVLKSELNEVKIDSETNAVFNFLKVFFFCSVHYHGTSLINFVKSAVTSAKNLMNCW